MTRVGVVLSLILVLSACDDRRWYECQANGFSIRGKGWETESSIKIVDSLGRPEFVFRKDQCRKV